MEEHDLTCEVWREYDFGGRTHRVDAPRRLFMRPGGTTHRVLDDKGIVHCFPAPGHFGCVLRWYPADSTKPVSF